MGERREDVKAAEEDKAETSLVICNQIHINIHLKPCELKASVIQLHYLRVTRQVRQPAI